MKNFERESVEITWILLILAENVKTIVKTTAFFLTLVIINLVFFTKPTFDSSSKFISSSGESNVSQMMGLATQFGLNVPSFGSSEPNWVYQDIIKSRTISRKVINRKYDSYKYGKGKTLLQIINNINGNPDYGKDTLETIAIDYLIDEMMFIIEDSKTGIFNLIINSYDPLLSKQVNQAIIDELDLHQQNYNSRVANKTRLFIEERILKTKSELENAEEELKVFRDRNRRIDNSPALLLEQERLEREVTVLTSVFTTLKQQLETSKIEEVRKSDYVILIDKPEIPIVRSSPNIKLTIVVTMIFSFCTSLVYILSKAFYHSMSKREAKKIKIVCNTFFDNLVGIFKLRNNAN
tara:strand:- start:421 stop:1473 length:1053 start_codon:yes stop_codon:yes gene_type:complete